MIRFLLNETSIETELPPGTVLLDFIRYHRQLMGTKIGCREGDCGACTVLVGDLHDGRLGYDPMTSCLVPLGNAHGKHIVTIEGINQPGTLNPVQQAMADEGATQCGFCTPGFVVSLAGFCLSDKESTAQNAIAAVDGNICRCTGYKSIERAASRVAGLVTERNDEEPAVFAAQQNILPAYFAEIKNKLTVLQNSESPKLSELPTPDSRLTTITAGGGTDLYVQKHDEMTDADIRFVFNDPVLKGITKKDTQCIIGPSATVSDLKNSSVINEAFPAFRQYAKLVSSTPIRNMATIAGNFMNASPIGDLTIFFLALDAQLVLSDGESQRELPLRKLYKGYKQLDKRPEEIIRQIRLELPGSNTLFHFEKVSKRTHLDIASVNTAICIRMNNDTIETAALSAGGVGPTPLFLQKASDFLTGKKVTEEIIQEAIAIVQTEISPISDARGTAEYKSFLLGQLIKAHFLKLFPELVAKKLLK